MFTKTLKTLRFRTYRIFEDMAASLLPPVLSLGYLEKQIRPSVAIPYYHIVSDERIAHIIHLHKYRNTGQFDADLDYFLGNFRPIGLDDLLVAVREGREVKEKAFILTVDDGLREVHDVIAPRLKRRGVPAIFFITTAFLDNQTLGYRHKASLLIERFKQKNPAPSICNGVADILGCADSSENGIRKAILAIKSSDAGLLDAIATLLEIDIDYYLADVQPYLTTEQVRSLIRNGFYIGAHSVDHPPYKTLTPTEQLTQTSQSTMLIKQRFGLDYALFAFPFSDYGVRAAFFEGLDGQIDLFFGTSAFCRESIRNNLHRFWMEDTNLTAEGILKDLYVRTCMRDLFGINSKKR